MKTKVTPTNTISMSDINNELNQNKSVSLGDSNVRQLAGAGNGQISMSQLRGKSSKPYPVSFLIDYYTVQSTTISNIKVYGGGSPYIVYEQEYVMGSYENKVIELPISSDKISVVTNTMDSINIGYTGICNVRITTKIKFSDGNIYTLCPEIYAFNVPFSIHNGRCPTV